VVACFSAGVVTAVVLSLTVMPTVVNGVEAASVVTDVAAASVVTGGNVPVSPLHQNLSDFLGIGVEVLYLNPPPPPPTPSRRPP
jgi:hypothetical protein